MGTANGGLGVGRRLLLACAISATLTSSAIGAVASGSGVVGAADPPPVPQLVRDINTHGLSSYPSDAVRFEGAVYFGATSREYGDELWRYQPNTGVLTMVADLVAGPDSSSARPIADAGGVLFFSAFDEAHGYELWKTDGTASGTVLVSDIKPGSASSDLGGGVDLDGELFFKVDDGTHGHELWRSDGTPGGTQLVEDINPGAADSSLFNLTVVPRSATENALYFDASNGTDGNELFRFDEVGGVTQLDLRPGAASSYPDQLVVSDRRLYLSATNPGGSIALYRVNGLTNVATDLGIATDVYDVVASASTVFVRADDGAATSLHDLYVVTSNTASPTLIENDVFISSPEVVGDTLVFQGESSGGRELWTSDGTVGGAAQLIDLEPGPVGSSPFLFRADVGPLGGALSDVVVFAANTSANGRQLWRTDLTAGGTYRLTDTGGSSSPSAQHVGPGLWMVDIDDDGPLGREPWMTNGTNAGTSLLADINTTTENSYADWYADVDGAVLFAADDWDHGSELWRHDTASGTQTLLDVVPGASGLTPAYITSLGRVAVFRGYSVGEGMEPWATDGTVAGTRRLVDIVPGAGSGLTGDFVTMGALAFFEAGGALWRTDGTLPGTFEVASGDVSDEQAVGDRLYFELDTAAAGHEPWVSDGTMAGTFMLADLDAGTGDSHPHDFIGFDGSTYFLTGDTLRRTGGVAGDVASAALPPDSDPLGLMTGAGSLFVSVNDHLSGEYQIWRTTDPTTGWDLVDFGTVTFDYPRADAAVVLGDRVIVPVEDASTTPGGDALAVIDGTSGTVLAVSSDGVYIAEVVAHRGWAYLAAEVDFETSLLVRTDGTVGGTDVLFESAYVDGSSRVDALTVIGEQLWFSGTRSEVGTEAFVVDVGPSTPSAPTGIRAAAGNAKATVSWTPPSDDGGEPIASYTVKAAPGGAMCTTTGALSCVVTGLKNGTRYAFTVTASNGFKTSLPSVPSNAVTPTAPGGPPTPPTPPGASGFVPLVPARLFESRSGFSTVDGEQANGGRVGAGSVTEVDVVGRGGVLPGTSAVSLNVTLVGPSGPGFATVFPCGEATPDASNVNYMAGAVEPNAVLSKVGAGGKVCVFSLTESDLIVDVNGAFT